MRTDDTTWVREDTCARCGTTYRGAAFDRLHARDGFDRAADGRIYVAMACVCRLDAFGHVERDGYGLALYRRRDDGAVLVGYHRGQWRSCLAVPVRTTPTMLVVLLVDAAGDGTAETSFRLRTGNEIGANMRMDAAEIARALRTLGDVRWRVLAADLDPVAGPNAANKANDHD